MSPRAAAAGSSIVAVLALELACGSGEPEPESWSPLPSAGAFSSESGANEPLIDAAARPSMTVAERAGLDVAMPDVSVSEWRRLADGSFEDEPAAPRNLTQLLRPGWAKVVVWEWYWCVPCKALIETLSTQGPHTADLIVLAVREPGDHLREDLRTKEALRHGRGWLVTMRGGDARAQSLMTRIDATVQVRPPTILILDRRDRVRAISLIGDHVPLERTVAWVEDQVSAIYNSDRQPKASLPIRRPPPPPRRPPPKRPRPPRDMVDSPTGTGGWPTLKSLLPWSEPAATVVDRR